MWPLPTRPSRQTLYQAGDSLHLLENCLTSDVSCGSNRSKNCDPEREVQNNAVLAAGGERKVPMKTSLKTDSTYLPATLS